MSVIGSCLMGAFGVSYCAMGVSMLVPGLNRKWASSAGQKEWAGLGALYPSLFKRFLQTEMGEAGEETIMGTGVRDLAELEKEDLAFRMLAYAVLLLGGLRVFVAVQWSCGAVSLGLLSCLAEMGLVGHELLRHESVGLTRAASLLGELCIVSLVFIGTSLPHCT
jgi:hypothetical protein